MEKNILDSLLDLEEEFYQEGYNLGATDGAQAGYTEGSVFAVEKGFEKFVELGRLYGKALVWAQRLADSDSSRNSSQESDRTDTRKSQPYNEGDILLEPFVCKEMLPLPPSSRLAKNLEILLELVDPASLPMENTEEAVTDVDERLKGATIKAKLIQRALGEREDASDIHPDVKDTQVAGDGTGSIEDISSLKRCGGVFPSRTMEYGLLIGLSPTGWQSTWQSTRLSVFNPGMRSSSGVINDDG
ncbi:Yae1 family protein [Aspergillus fischeri NRRL 181]|uniref:Essential protein Yae1 N-terminal domain-containing protein n=1 Tax=Neosartorya fischeri (strain ATCC 1020 / DSM 3700 / CBS 544.65 / FGSC A1164 / JCM 1740 / NRRL 181 / WB 181) TaxID=331117 RepID=A1D3H5_NEOFI|nr:conserved hypothetical protein [Aspergillus fischeri NRRL 181]EAW22968.1 conserved hypothetical protein [Aspergillus fischeri NRRL 181]KAG2002187.1 hypothetical protein GB937_009688 [Aspergillus fischeri]